MDHIRAAGETLHTHMVSRMSKTWKTLFFSEKPCFSYKKKTHTLFFSMKNPVFLYEKPCFSLWKTLFFSMKNPVFLYEKPCFSLWKTLFFSMKNPVFLYEKPSFSLWKTQFFSMKNPVFHANHGKQGFYFFLPIWLAIHAYTSGAQILHVLGLYHPWTLLQSTSGRHQHMPWNYISFHLKEKGTDRLFFQACAKLFPTAQGRKGLLSNRASYPILQSYSVCCCVVPLVFYCFWSIINYLQFHFIMKSYFL